MTLRKPRLRTRLRDAWRVLRHGLPESEYAAGIAVGPALVLPESSAFPALVELSKPIPRPPAPSSLGDCRVTRERDGRIVETLYQGSGAIAAQQYAHYTPERPGEWIRFYRGNDACSGKHFGD